MCVLCVCNIFQDFTCIFFFSTDKIREDVPYLHVCRKEGLKGVWKGRKEGTEAEGGREGGGAEGKKRKREEAETARFGSTTRLTLRRRPGRLRGCRSTLLLGHPYPHPYPRGWIEAGRPIFRAPLDSSSPLVAALFSSRDLSSPVVRVARITHRPVPAPTRTKEVSKETKAKKIREERIPISAVLDRSLSPRGRKTRGNGL